MVFQRVLVDLPHDMRVGVAHCIRDLLDRRPGMRKQRAERVPGSVTRPPAAERSELEELRRSDIDVRNGVGMSTTSGRICSVGK
jgi:hypothetical protein